ncbi:hypothetical protein EX30DRAFT_135273 [Ascodesmis nigricans]|uniref:Uncharacterized protein n=1 Tax=Ascodesmis nigricans TaxID=341454 RepID=A0A4V3SI31_9PEZI|nr:hypothetical protein EX30DRAFT_135273 [Ascodesmis nigricans]
MEDPDHYWYPDPHTPHHEGPEREGPYATYRFSKPAPIGSNIDELQPAPIPALAPGARRRPPPQASNGVMYSMTAYKKAAEAQQEPTRHQTVMTAAEESAMVSVRSMSGKLVSELAAAREREQILRRQREEEQRMLQTPPRYEDQSAMMQVEPESVPPLMNRHRTSPAPYEAESPPFESYGYPNDGYANDGYEDGGYASDGYSNDGYSNDGYSNDRYSNGYLNDEQVEDVILAIDLALENTMAVTPDSLTYGHRRSRSASDCSTVSSESTTQVDFRRMTIPLPEIMSRISQESYGHESISEPSSDESTDDGSSTFRLQKRPKTKGRQAKVAPLKIDTSVKTKNCRKVILVKEDVIQEHANPHHTGNTKMTEQHSPHSDPPFSELAPPTFSDNKCPSHLESRRSSTIGGLGISVQRSSSKIARKPIPRNLPRHIDPSMRPKTQMDSPTLGVLATRKGPSTLLPPPVPSPQSCTTDTFQSSPLDNLIRAYCRDDTGYDSDHSSNYEDVLPGDLASLYSQDQQESPVRVSTYDDCVTGIFDLLDEPGFTDPQENDDFDVLQPSSSSDHFSLMRKQPVNIPPPMPPVNAANQRHSQDKEVFQHGATSVAMSCRITTFGDDIEFPEFCPHDDDDASTPDLESPPSTHVMPTPTAQVHRAISNASSASMMTVPIALAFDTKKTLPPYPVLDHPAFRPRPHESSSAYVNQFRDAQSPFSSPRTTKHVHKDSWSSAITGITTTTGISSSSPPSSRSSHSSLPGNIFSASSSSISSPVGAVARRSDPLSISRETMRQDWTEWPPVKLDMGPASAGQAKRNASPAPSYSSIGSSSSGKDEKMLSFAKRWMGK